MPLLGQPWVCSYRLALAEALVALTERADEAVSTPSQTVNPGFPLMLSPAPMLAAWAEESDPLSAPRSEVCRLLALVTGGVPHALEECIVWVHQRLPAIRSTCKPYAFSLPVMSLTGRALKLIVTRTYQHSERAHHPGCSHQGLQRSDGSAID